MSDLAKSAGNEYGMLVDDGIFGGEVSQYIDTGSYVFNALLSGSIYGGLPANKITAIAGESATGKTFFTLGIIKHFLDMNPTAGCIYFESESALTSDMLKDRGIDTTRVYHMPVATVEEFRHQAVKILEKHGEIIDDVSGFFGNVVNNQRDERCIGRQPETRYDKGTSNQGNFSCSYIDACKSKCSVHCHQSCV